MANCRQHSPHPSLYLSSVFYLHHSPTGRRSIIIEFWETEVQKNSFKKKKKSHGKLGFEKSGSDQYDSWVEDFREPGMELWTEVTCLWDKFLFVRSVHSSILYITCKYLSVCVYMCVCWCLCECACAWIHVCTCICMWRAEVDIWFLHQSLLILFFQRLSLNLKHFCRMG